MYFPIGWPKYLKVDYNDGCLLVNVSTSYDKILNAILSEKSVGIWFCKPHVEIASFKRSQTCVSQRGKNLFCLWKPDSSCLAVATSNGYIIFFKIDKVKSSRTCYEQKLISEAIHEESLSDFQSIPALTIANSHYVQIPGGVTSMASLREELMISTGRGLLQRVCWSDGGIKSNATVELASLPFSADLQHSRSTQLNNTHVHVMQLDYSPQMGGFAVVLSDGRGAFLAANSLKFEPHQVVGVWAQEVTSATSVCINHKFALIAFGDSSGQGMVYYLDGATGSLVISHKLVVSSKDFPDASQVCGPVTVMKYTSDGSALAMAWRKGGFAIWSVFGSLLLQSIGNYSGLSEGNQKILKFVSLDWGCEGYHLWIIENKHQEIKNSSCDGDQEVKETPSSSMLILNFVKSSLSANPCLGNQVHLLLQGEERLYLNPEDGLGESSISNHQSPSAIVGNRQWHVMNLPPNYIANNWPIRYTAISSSGHWIAVAGRRGFVHYTLSSRRWKMFGNETQERDMIVTGGLSWWRDFICVACYNLVDQRDEIRFYPRDSKLDNTFAHVIPTTCQIVLLNVFFDLVIVLFSDCVICIYSVAAKSANNDITVTKLQEINIVDYILHPSNVIAIALTSLRTDSGSVKKTKDTKDAESILINVAGRLLLFQREQSSSVETSPHKNWLSFTAPIIVASAVENMWLSWRSNHQKPHLTNALWLGCGSAGIKVWLPLQLKEDHGKNKGFLSKRIMLPFSADIYPLAMLFEAGIILGASSEAVVYTSVSSQHKLPFLQLERTSQVYLHHILRQLLRRNLGAHALEIARSCTNLVYFPHVLELLIHEVLEEEATSKEPIPDALLPRVVAFVEEFPEHLQTIAHCARKSDVAVWEYFFTVVGSPVDLFQECLATRKLNTAASYLIILQNLEKPAQAQQHAIALLDAALEDSSWDLARDLVRYFSVIDLENREDNNSAPKRIRQNSQSIYPGFYTPPAGGNPDSIVDPFLHAGVVRARSLSKEEQARDQPHSKQQKARPDGMANKSRHVSGLTKELEFGERMNIDGVLDRHAKKLLKSYKLCDLAKFAANLEDYQLVSWLKKERLLSAKVEDFVSALKAIHEDFKWPYPIVPVCNLSRLSSANCLAMDSEQKSSQPGSPHLNSDRSSIVSGTNKGESMDQSEVGSYGACERESSDSWNEVAGSSLTMTTPTELEQLCLDLAAMKTGSPLANIQLRFLFQLMSEAGCLEWSLVVSLVLQDVSLFSRVVSSAYLADTSEECVRRLVQGIKAFQKWSDSEWCYGYKNLIESLKEDILLLESLEKKASASNTSTLGSARRPSAIIPRSNSIDIPSSVPTKNETESNSLSPGAQKSKSSKSSKDSIEKVGTLNSEEGGTANGGSDRMCIVS